jgi:hypothetical protein
LPAVTEHQFTEQEDDWGFKKYMAISIIQDDVETWLDLDEDEALHVSVGVTMRLVGPGMKLLKSLYGFENSSYIRHQVPVVWPQSIQVCHCCHRPAGSIVPVYSSC